MAEHAYPFFNGGWNQPRKNDWSDDMFKAGDTLSEFLSPLDAWIFWKCVGYEKTNIFNKDVTQFAAGLCYGMTSSAIANYTHRQNETFS